MKHLFTLRIGIVAFLCSLLLGLTACGGGGSVGTPESTPTGNTFAISSQPSDQAVVPGAAAKFSVVASGAGTYQWQTWDGAAWRHLAGATSPDINVTNVVMADNGRQFRVSVTSAANSALSITSSIATLTVTEAEQAPAISVQPLDLSLTEGQNGAFSVTATGSTLQYNWQTSTDGTNWADTGTASNPNFLVIAATVPNSGKLYRALISNRQGSVTTKTVVLTVLSVPTVPTVAVQPRDVSVVIGQSATLSAQITGTPTPSLQWQSSADGASWA
ncbi:MAG: hypothetical protein JWQ88_3712, partial [Rhodoferax sp.]|nr:hypothetical protein [Rhodoferax sp.]